MNYDKHYLIELLPHICTIANQAGKLILKYYKKATLRVCYKADRTQVTIADFISEKYIISILSNLLPNVHIISEEAFSRNKINYKQQSYFWLIDPLDGTEGFILGNDQFSVNIALIVNFKPILGVIYFPIADIIYYGLAEGDSYFQKYPSHPKKIATRSNSRDNKSILLYPYAPISKELRSYLDQFPNRVEINNSDAFRYCRVANGEVDECPYFWETCEWDTAAAHAILKGAGGNMYTLDGDELRYGKTNFKNPYFIAKG